MGLKTFVFFAALAVFPLAAQAQFELRGTGWVNSRELSLERLRGKVVVLLFFEEECPLFRATVADRVKMRKTMEGKPVVFIAVNSGNPKSKVEEYAKSTGWDWPILVDEHRETEKQFGWDISLHNVYQAALIDPEGKRQRCNPGIATMVQSVNEYLPSAKFTFDGIMVPPRLQAAAREIEMGFYEPAIEQVAALAQKPSEDQAKAMYERLKPIAEKGLDAAKALQAEGKKYAAYLEYSKIANWFGKTDYEKTAAAAAGELKKDKEVQDEIKAQAMLAQVRAMLASNKKTDQANGQTALAALKKKYPDSLATKEAATIK